MLDDAQTQELRLQPRPQLRAGPLAAAPAGAWPGAGVPPSPWGPPPSGLGGPVAGMPPVVPPPARRPRWPWILAAVAAVVVVLGLFGTVLARSATVSGTQTIEGGVYLPLGSSCTGAGWYSDLQPGASVLVYDEKGEQVGQGVLGAGITVSSSGGSSYGYGSACRFTYSVSVASSDSYRVVVGQRTGVVFTPEQANGHADLITGR